MPGGELTKQLGGQPGDAPQVDRAAVEREEVLAAPGSCRAAYTRDQAADAEAVAHVHALRLGVVDGQVCKGQVSRKRPHCLPPSTFVVGLVHFGQHDQRGGGLGAENRDGGTVQRALTPVYEQSVALAVDGVDHLGKEDRGSRPAGRRKRHACLEAHVGAGEAVGVDDGEQTRQLAARVGQQAAPAHGQRRQEVVDGDRRAGRARARQPRREPALAAAECQAARRARPLARARLHRQRRRHGHQRAQRLTPAVNKTYKLIRSIC